MASRPSRRSPEGGPRAGWDRAARLVRKSDFEAVYRQGARLKSPQFVVFYRATGAARSRFGISVKKAVGGAVVRNRIRRRIRDILRRNLGEIPSGWDFVTHPRRSVARSNFATLESELVGLLQTVPRPAAPPATPAPR